MMNFCTSRWNSLPLASLLVLTICFASSCSRESESTNQDSAPTSSGTPKGPGESSSPSIPNNTQLPQPVAEKPKTLVERWTDLDLPIDEGPGLELPGIVFARLHIDEKGIWHLSVARSRRFTSVDAEVPLGRFDEAAFGSKPSEPWSEAQGDKLRATNDKIAKVLRSAVNSQRNVQSVNLSIFDKPMESSLLHIDKTAPMGLIAMVTDAIESVRSERKKKQDDTPLSVTFSNTEPAGFPSKDASAPKEKDKGSVPPTTNVSYPVSTSGSIRDKHAKDTCAVYFFNVSPDAPTADGWRIRIGKIDAKPLTEVAEVRQELQAALASTAAGTDADNGFPNLRLLIYADYRAPSHFLSVIYAACMHGDVRIYKISFATLNAVVTEGD